MSDTVEIIIRAKDEASKPIGNVSKALGGMGKAAGVIGGVAGAAFVAIGAAAVAGFGMAIKQSIAVNSQLETTELQFETLMGNADKAKEHVAGLFEFAEKTPFETGPIIEASLKLETFGGAALNTKDNLTLLGDAAAAVNAPIDELGFWVGRLYANLQAGQPFGEAAMRLQELAVMSPQARQAMEDLQKSGASASEIFGVLQEDLGRFSGAMEKQAGTWEGMVSTIKDQVNLLMGEALKPFFDKSKEGLETLIALLNDPDIRAGIVAIGEEFVRLGNIITTVMGGAITKIAQMGMLAANAEIIEQLRVTRQEYQALYEEMEKQVNVGAWTSAEEELEIQTLINSALQERYANELQLISVKNEAQQSARIHGEMIREYEESQAQFLDDQLAGWAGIVSAVEPARAAVTQYATDMTIWGDNANIARYQALELGTAFGYNAEQIALADAKLAAFGSAFREGMGDYVTELPAAMEPLVSIIDGVAGSQYNLAVNTDGVKQAIFEQLGQMGAAPEVMAAFGLATGIMTEQQAIAALAAATVKVKIEELAQKIAEGVPVETALADLDSFIAKINDELIPAAMNAAGEVPDHFRDMIGPVGVTAIEIGTALIDGVTEGITSNVSKATGAADDAASAVISTTKNTYQSQSPSRVFSTIGADLMLGLLQGINREVPALLSRVAELGRNIIQGMINGLLDAAGALYSTIAGIIQQARDAAGAAAGEGSPARLFIPLGHSIGQGIAQGIEESATGIYAVLESTLKQASTVGGIMGGFETVFKDRILTPIENQVKALKGQLTGNADSLKGMLGELGLGDSLNDPMLFERLKAIATGATGAGFNEMTQAQNALALLEQRQDLIRQEQRMQEQLISQQQRLMLLEQQRADIAFLQQQFELLKLIRDNNLGADLLQGVELGLGADPGALMRAMSEALQMLLGQTASTLQGATPAPASRSLADGFFNRAATGASNAVTINIDARQAAPGVEKDIRRVVEDVMREQGLRADIRMRTGNV